jgi:hypothetical protein
MAARPLVVNAWCLRFSMLLMGVDPTLKKLDQSNIGCLGNGRGVTSSMPKFWMVVVVCKLDRCHGYLAAG